MSRNRFRALLVLLLVVAVAARIAYVVAQPSSDPAFAIPMLDGAYYLEWARGLLSGGGGPGGAFYLAPLYAFALAAVVKVAGENLAVVYVVQHLAIVGSAALLALVSRRRAGAAAGLATAALVLLYHPVLFFASRPLGEPLAVLVLAAALYLVGREEPVTAGLAGLVGGIAALARPNLLLVPVLWAADRGVRRRWATAGLIAAGVGLALLPVAWHNARASGHLVPVSSNGGVTFYQGNGPRATGAYTLLPGFSGRLEDQRDEATRLARLRAGHEMDAVEADRWWGIEGLRARAADPWGTVVLLARKLRLLVASRELSLDYAPGIDANPWRFAAPVPFALILGLAGAGVVLRGVRGSGGAPVWEALAACAAAPLLFYVSSRYRLPMAVLLCVPAGSGAAALASSSRSARRRAGAGAVAIALIVGSWLASDAKLANESDAVARANRAVAWQRAGDVARAERELRAALAADPRSVAVLFNLGVVLEERGRSREAESYYERAVRLDPGHAGAAGNLGGLLIRGGRARAAATVLRRALALRPLDRTCWTNLVVALVSLGNRDGARAAAREARRFGVRLNAELLEEIAPTKDEPSPPTGPAARRGTH